MTAWRATRRGYAGGAAPPPPPPLGQAVLAFGAAHAGALGLGAGAGDAYEPARVPGLPADVVAVGAGHFTSFAISAAGEAWSWGRATEGQLGRPLAPGEAGTGAAPVRVAGLARHAVVAATGSGVASFFLTTEGALFACGSSKRGQLGLGAGVQAAREPRRIDLPGRAVSVSAGWGHTVAVLDDGSTWSWGWPAAGRLGHSFAPAGGAASEADEAELSARCAWAPRRVEALGGARAAAAACGFDHTLLLLQDGALLSFGDDSLGQLGRAGRAEGEAAAPADALSWQVRAPAEGGGEARFCAVAAGLGHSLAVATDGEVFSFGWDAFGQLGLGEHAAAAAAAAAPAPVFGVPHHRRARVAAGRSHSVLLTDDVRHERGAWPRAGGRAWPLLTTAFSWGGASGGRLGTGAYADARFPELIPALDGEALLDVACGLDHTLVLVQVDEAVAA
jgi:alpha-tubulin suppressor-like RCC1 family protein